MTPATRQTRRRSCGSGAARAAVLLLVVATGCGRSGPTLVPVSGSVTFDGQPVETGEIVFRAVDGAVTSGAGPIVAGRYAARAPVGSKRVEIIATRPARGAAAKPSISGEPTAAEMFVPDRYNAESTLTAEVTAGGPNEFDFTLTSGSAAK